MMFIVGFCKIAGASNTTGMMSAVTDAAKQTSMGQSVVQAGQNFLKDNKLAKKVRNINLFGKAPATATATPAGSVAQPISKWSPNLAIKDMNRLQFNAGNFRAEAGAKGVNAQYGLGGGFGLQASKGGGNTSAGVFFKKEF